MSIPKPNPTSEKGGGTPGRPAGSPELPSLLPFRLIAAALRGVYLLVHAAVIVSGLLAAGLLAAMCVYGFRAGFAAPQGGTGPILLGIGGGAILLAAALPIGRRTAGFAWRFARREERRRGACASAGRSGSRAGSGASEARHARASRTDSKIPAPPRTLEQAYRAGRSLFAAANLLLLGVGLSAIGCGLALDGLRRFVG